MDDKLILAKKLFDECKFFHKQLWGKMARQYIKIDKDKNTTKRAFYNGLELYYDIKKNYNEKPWGSSCFACDVLSNLEILSDFNTIECEFCPIDWGKTPSSRQIHNCQSTIYSSYIKYMHSNDEFESQKLAIEIRDMPWDFERIIDGLTKLELMEKEDEESK